MSNFKKSLSIDPKGLGSSLSLAKLFLKLGEKDRAIKYFKHTLKIDPNNADANLALGKIYLEGA